MSRDVALCRLSAHSELWTLGFHHNEKLYCQYKLVSAYYTIHFRRDDSWDDHVKAFRYHTENGKETCPNCRLLPLQSINNHLQKRSTDNARAACRLCIATVLNRDSTIHSRSTAASLAKQIIWQLSCRFNCKRIVCLYLRWIYLRTRPNCLLTCIYAIMDRLLPFFLDFPEEARRSPFRRLALHYNIFYSLLRVANWV